LSISRRAQTGFKLVIFKMNSSGVHTNDCLEIGLGSESGGKAIRLASQENHDHSDSTPTRSSSPSRKGNTWSFKRLSPTGNRSKENTLDVSPSLNQPLVEDSLSNEVTPLSLLDRIRLARRRRRGNRKKTKREGSTAVSPSESKGATEVVDTSPPMSDISDNSVTAEHLDDFDVEESRDCCSGSATWTIHVLNDRNKRKQVLSDPSALWFRIFFPREDDYVYYKREEIVEYVRNLLEFDASCSFAITLLSSGQCASVDAQHIVDTLESLIARHRQKARLGPSAPKTSSPVVVPDICDECA